MLASAIANDYILLYDQREWKVLRTEDSFEKPGWLDILMRSCDEHGTRMVWTCPRGRTVQAHPPLQSPNRRGSTRTHPPIDALDTRPARMLQTI